MPAADLPSLETRLEACLIEQVIAAMDHGKARLLRRIALCDRASMLV